MKLEFETDKFSDMEYEDSTKIFKKQKDDLKNLATKLYPKVAENICQFIDDPEEREKHLNDLRLLGLEHAKLEIEIKVQEDALDHTTKKLKEVKDLEIEKVLHSLICIDYVLSRGGGAWWVGYAFGHPMFEP